ncbi:MAG: S-layer homology domain-containing protein [Nitriliruptoraceae bacterium]
MRAAPQRGRLLTQLLLVTALLATLVPTPPALAAPSAQALEQDFHALVNIERAQRGLGALEECADIVAVARSHSQTMASETRLFHNPDYSREITGWTRVSENVGYGPSVSSIHRALMNSEGHRRNILDEKVTEIGIGVVVEDGRVWVTQNFRRPTGTVTANAPTSRLFGDVTSTSVHTASIERIANVGIADPCGEARFCPADQVSRAEFAEMLVRALDLPRSSSTSSRFRDVSGETARCVEALATAGLTNGCGGDRFCPDARLTREQLASFFARALDLPPRTSPFPDVSEAHAGAVGALAAEGIVNGCTTTHFCASDRISRAQTASMIARHLG